MSRPSIDGWTLTALLNHCGNEPDPDTGCVLWTCRPHGEGYGAVSVNGADVTAHRLALALAHGLDKLPPSNVLALHRCPSGHDRRCISPSHLAWGSAADNVADAIAAGTHVSVTRRAGELDGQLSMFTAGAT